MKLKVTLGIALLSLFVVTCKHKLPEPTTPTTTTTTSGTTTGGTTSGTTTGGTTTGGTTGGLTNAKDSVCYEQEIGPLLNSNCASNSGCHNATDKEDGIDLSSYSALKATMTGKLLLKVISETDPKKRMPKSPLPALTTGQINLITNWVNQGMKQGIDCQAACDTLNISYSGHIKKIVEDNCFGCHQTFSPVFTNYDQLKTQIVNGKFACSINHGSGCSAMPKNTTKLSDCKIKQITIWLNAGFPNN